MKVLMLLLVVKTKNNIRDDQFRSYLIEEIRKYPDVCGSEKAGVLKTKAATCGVL